jgi:hypothetical protein
MMTVVFFSNFSPESFVATCNSNEKNRTNSQRLEYSLGNVLEYFLGKQSTS